MEGINSPSFLFFLSYREKNFYFNGTVNLVNKRRTKYVTYWMHIDRSRTVLCTEFVQWQEIRRSQMGEISAITVLAIVAIVAIAAFTKR